MPPESRFHTSGRFKDFHGNPFEIAFNLKYSNRAVRMRLFNRTGTSRYSNYSSFIGNNAMCGKESLMRAV